jgi:short-subunit dehydrogenase
VEVAGSRVLVTGASSGIGATLAERLAERGATVGLVARRADRLDEVLERCQAHQPDSQRWVCDLADLDGAERLAVEAWDAFGHLDVLVNNAAVPKRRAATALTAAEVEQTMAVNFHSPVRMTLALLPRMLERDAGVIVNVASIAGRLGVFREAAYSASKFALSGWSESLAVDLWDTGIDVRLIHPGAIDTEIWDQPDNDRPVYQGPKEGPEVVADGTIAAIEGDRFEHYLPDLKVAVELKTSDIDIFLQGLADEARRAAP